MRLRDALLSGVLLAAATGVLAQDAKEAETRLRQVRGELQSVAGERRRLEGQRGDVGRKLQEADRQVALARQALQQTRARMQQDEAALARLQAERARQAGDLASRRAELARLLRAAQQAGDASPLQTLLAQDRVADAERSLIYQGYLQRAQVARIRQLGQEIARLQALEDAILQRRSALEAAGRAQATQLADLQRAREARARLLGEIDQQYRDRTAREKALGQDAKALQNLLAQLRAAAAKAAREAARARQEAARQAKDGTRPAPSRALVTSAPVQRVGGPSWPVSGNLLAAFGGRLPDGRRSDGVLIAAPAGSPVKAVAAGTVVFADWMTGYGNILIVDHGNGYMSLYAHNDGLLHGAGDPVRRGEAIATVGSSGGQEAPALYFELRRNGTPVDPSAWLTRQ